VSSVNGVTPDPDGDVALAPSDLPATGPAWADLGEELQAKLDKRSDSTDTGQVYAKVPSGSQTVVPYSADPTVGAHLPLTDAYGRVRVGYPDTDDHAVNQAALQAALYGKRDLLTGNTTYDEVYVKRADGSQGGVEATSQLAPDTVLVRDGDGCAAVSDGQADYQAATVGQLLAALAGKLDVAKVVQTLSQSTTEVPSAKAVTDAISGLAGFRVEVVAELPSEGEAGVIYMLGDAPPYEEFLWVDGAWEDIGSTAVDLTAYLLKVVSGDGWTRTVGDAADSIDFEVRRSPALPPVNTVLRLAPAELAANGRDEAESWAVGANPQGFEMASATEATSSVLEVTGERLTFTGSDDGQETSLQVDADGLRVNDQRLVAPARQVTLLDVPEMTASDRWVGEVELAAGFELVSVSADRSLRVRVYTDQVSQSADQDRPVDADPAVGVGVVFELVTGSKRVWAAARMTGAHSVDGSPTWPVTVDLMSAPGVPVVEFQWVPTE
jgi:hypothetical protein